MSLAGNASEERIERLLGQLSLTEMVSLLSGEDFWSLPSIARLGIHKLRVTDGPNGARGGGGLVGGVKSAAFPVGIALGATWDPELVAEIGAALAQEVKSKGAHVSLSPTVNIHRSVTNGRNFECYSEDPILTAKLGGAFIAGLQGQGIAATVKHLVGNESEIERTTMSSEIDERTLREIYLVPFEHAVKVADTWGIMSSYNRLNGTYTSESRWLLTEVLREQWHYSGVVTSDWFGSHSTVPTVTAGLDLEMPGPPRDRGQKLIDAVTDGSVDPAQVRELVRRVLRLMIRTGAIDDDSPFAERAEDRPEHRALIRRAGAAATVLLTNNGILPLREGIGRIAVIGPNAKTAQIMGGGSSQLNPHYSVSPWQGLSAALGEDRLVHALGVANNRFEPLLDQRFDVEYFASRDLSGDVVHREAHIGSEIFAVGQIAGGKVDPAAWSARYTTLFTPKATGVHRVGIASTGLARVLVDGVLVADDWTDWHKGRTFFEEGSDEVVGTIHLEAQRSYRVEVQFATMPAAVLLFAAFRLGIGLPPGDVEFAEAVAAARSAELAIVCVGRNGEWDTEGSDLLDIKLPGRQDELVSAVAAANPNTVVVLQTGGPVEMPWIGEVAAVLQAWYPGQEAGNSVADVLTGASEPGGRLPQTFPVRWSDNPANSQDREVYPGLEGRVRYAEGVFIGYRHYDRFGIAPLFPFGFGLSYTKIALGDFSVDTTALDAKGEIVVSMSATNIGARAGSEVVQLYVGDPVASVARPKKELKAFAKVHLEAGESRPVRLTLSARDFAFFDVGARAWLAEAGDFELSVATSAAAPAFTRTVRLKEALTIAT